MKGDRDGSYGMMHNLLFVFCLVLNSENRLPLLHDTSLATVTSSLTNDVDKR